MNNFVEAKIWVLTDDIGIIEPLPILGSTTIQSLMPIKNFTEFEILVQNEVTNDIISYNSYFGFHKVIYGPSWW